MISLRQVSVLVTALACCGALSACGGNSNPKVNSSDFISACSSKTNAGKTKGTVPASVNVASYCQCVQQKLVSAGLGNKAVNDLNNNTAAGDAVSSCKSSALSSPTQPTPGTPSTPSTTTT